MERLVVVWCPSLLTEGDQGREVRHFIEVLDATGELCPWVEPVRLGVCALPARGPSRLFGGERALLQRLARSLEQLLGTAGVRVGVADGLFAACLAAQSGLIVPREGTAGFLGPWSVTVLQRPELAVVLQRLGVHTLGQFGSLPSADISARFGADAAACHRVARGQEGELAGWRDPGIIRRLQQVGGPVAARIRQGSFFGGRSASERRAEASFARVQRRLGAEAVVTARLLGGHDPADRMQLVPWGSRSLGPSPGGRTSRGADRQDPPGPPWPGQLPPPSPVTVPATPVPAALVDAGGAGVGVTGRGLLTATPHRCSLAGGPWQEVVAWAGPWPMVERWWSSRRRRARLQVVTAAEVALLLAVEREAWWLVGLYD